MFDLLNTEIKGMQKGFYVLWRESRLDLLKFLSQSQIGRSRLLVFFLLEEATDPLDQGQQLVE